jgi:hypothetical protein
MSNNEAFYEAVNVLSLNPDGQAGRRRHGILVGVKLIARHRQVVDHRPKLVVAVDVLTDKAGQPKTDAVTPPATNRAQRLTVVEVDDDR